MKWEAPLLEMLRWDVDQCVTNPFGERVWLKACLNDKGERIGITDCCPADDPCNHHEKISNDPHARRPS